MRRSVWIGFGGFCVLSSVSWLILPLAESGLPVLEQKFLLHVVTGLGALLFTNRGLWSRIHKLPWVLTAVGGVLFFGLPAVLIDSAGGGLPTVTNSATFALMPAMVVLFTVNSSEAVNKGEGRGLLTPAIAALGGLLLLLPVELPQSIKGWETLVMMFATVTLVAGSGVWMHRLMQSFKIADAFVAVCCANALFLLVWTVGTGSFVWQGRELSATVLTTMLIDLSTMLLALWLLREMSPVRFAARYLVIPLVAVMEGYVVLRPELTVRMVSGTVLLVAGTGWILLFSGSDDEVVLSLR